jgi:hypothetical protein
MQSARDSFSNVLIEGYLTVLDHIPHNKQSVDKSHFQMLKSALKSSKPSFRRRYVVLRDDGKLLIFQQKLDFHNHSEQQQRLKRCFRLDLFELKCNEDWSATMNNENESINSKESDFTAVVYQIKLHSRYNYQSQQQSLLNTTSTMTTTEDKNQYVLILCDNGDEFSLWVNHLKAFTYQ